MTASVYVTATASLLGTKEKFKVLVGAEKEASNHRVFTVTILIMF